jgi:hypothetical protein
VAGDWYLVGDRLFLLLQMLKPSTTGCRWLRCTSTKINGRHVTDLTQAITSSMRFVLRPPFVPRI